MDQPEQFRQPHILRETKSNDRPQQILLIEVCSIRSHQAFDSEHIREHFSYAIVKRYRRRGKDKICVRLTRCETIEATWEEVTKFLQAGSCTYLFMMNAFESLTVLGFWEQLALKQWELTDSRKPSTQLNRGNGGRRWRGYAVLERPPTVVQCRVPGTNKTLKILDPQNYGIREWNDLLPIYVRTPTGFDLCYKFTDNSDYIPKQRIEALESWLDSYIALLDEKDLGSMQNTSASQALHSFRHRFMSSPIVIHGNEPAIKLERQAYHGGRCEAYYLGQIGQPSTLFPLDKTTNLEPRIFEAPSKIYHLDVSSMYLALTSNAVVPTQLKGYYNGGFLSIDDLSGLDGCVIADVDIETSEPIYPIVTANGLCWPTGRFRSQLCGPEIEIAQDKGQIKNVWAIAHYDGDKLFESWSRMWCDIKERSKGNGHKSIERMAKSIGVSLFGKFGQQNWNWVDCPTHTPMYPYEQWLGRSPETQELCHWRSFVWQVQYQGEKREHYHSFPGLAAWVTSLGRACLWQLMCVAGRDNVYYVDTDSVWTNEIGYNALIKAGLINDNIPGMLRLVETVSSLFIWGIKHYRADNRIVCSGMSNKVSSTEMGLATWDEQESMSAAMWQRRPAEGNIVSRSININNEYRLGKVDKQGKVNPLVLKEW